MLFATPEYEDFKFGVCDDYLEFEGDYLSEKRES